MFEVTVEDSFAAGHYLRNYKGKCENPHGHNYKIRVTLAGAELDKAGLLLDFKDLREVIVRAKDRRRIGEGTLLFLDEISRWSKAQQDALLPYVESGMVVLIGATTENPGFELKRALRSRLKIEMVRALSDDDLSELIDRGIRGTYQDEFTIGIERLLAPTFTVGLKGTYRRLGNAIEDRCDLDYNNPANNGSGSSRRPTVSTRRKNAAPAQRHPNAPWGYSPTACRRPAQRWRSPRAPASS